jgi:hypothetical protein
MKPINKIILSISILLLAQLSFAADQEAGEKHEKTVIGHEQSSTGAKVNIYGGDLATVDIWGAYITAHNTRDLDAIHKANADDFMGWAANGIIVNGPAAQAAFLKEWFAASSPKWTMKYAIANEVADEDGGVQQWVTSAYTVTDTIDGKEVASEEIYDVRIENGKVKNIYVAARAIIPAE